MKAFFEEYGLSTIIGCVICLLVVMASPVGAAINSNLKTTSTNMKDTGTAVEAKAGKSIKALAGEEEEVPDTIFVGYNSQNNCLVFSHDENSAQYSACDIKYGDVYNDTYSNELWRPWNSVRDEITNVNIENKIKPKYTAYWFDSFSNLTNLELSNLDTSNVTDMGAMFRNCKKLTLLDLSNFNTSNVTVMQNMFRGLNLTSIDLSNFDTSNVTDMMSLFYGCTKITSLDLSSFNTSNVTRMRSMFADCQQLTEIIYGNNFVKNPNCDTTQMFGPSWIPSQANKPSWWN